MPVLVLKFPQAVCVLSDQRMCDPSRVFQSTGGESADHLPKSTAEKREERYTEVYRYAFSLTLASFSKSSSLLPCQMKSRFSRITADFGNYCISHLCLFYRCGGFHKNFNTVNLGSSQQHKTITVSNIVLYYLCYLRIYLNQEYNTVISI